MASHTSLTNLFTDIADAIRTKKQTTNLIVADTFPTQITNLPGYTLLGSTEITTSSTSTSASSVGTISIGASAYTADKIIYVKVRDKAGIRQGYFIGSDTFFFNFSAANGATDTLTAGIKAIHRKTSQGVITTYTTSETTGYGVYGYSITSAGVVNIYRRYNSTYSLIINGTYSVEVYSLDYPPIGGNPFNYSY